MHLYSDKNVPLFLQICVAFPTNLYLYYDKKCTAIPKKIWYIFKSFLNWNRWIYIWKFCMRSNGQIVPTYLYTLLCPGNFILKALQSFFALSTAKVRVPLNCPCSSSEFICWYKSHINQKINLAEHLEGQPPLCRNSGMFK